jgi:uncharacterized RDD family membrane protein YckC
VANEQTPPPGRPGEAPPQQGYQQAPPGQQPATQQVAGAPAQQLAGPLPRASFGQRFGAFAIDILIIVVIEILLVVIFGGLVAALANTGSGAGSAVAALLGIILFIVYVALPIVYFGYMEGQPSGQTFGKRALNIRVVDFNTAGPITLGRGMLRSLIRSLISGIFLLGYLWMLWDPQQQCWHDKVATTTVVPTSAYPV